MTYYLQGDYYRGDYYMGDPGFFSAIGGFFKKAVGAILPSVPVVGGIYSGAKALLGRSSPAAAGMALAPRGMAGALKMPSRLTRLGAVTLGAGAMGAGYALRGRRGRAAAAQAVPGAPRRYRRMNVTNVRALRRSIRRCQGFSRLAKRVLRFTSPRPPRGRAVFRVRRRKKVC